MDKFDGTIRTIAYTIAVEIIENYWFRDVRDYCLHVLQNPGRFNKAGLQSVSAVMKDYTDRRSASMFDNHGLEFHPERLGEMKNIVFDFVLRALIYTPSMDTSPKLGLKLAFPIEGTITSPLLYCEWMSRNKDDEASWLVAAMGKSFVTSYINEDFQSMAVLIRPQENETWEGPMEYKVTRTLSFDKAIPFDVTGC